MADNPGELQRRLSDAKDKLGEVNNNTKGVAVSTGDNDFKLAIKIATPVDNTQTGASTVSSPTNSTTMTATGNRSAVVKDSHDNQVNTGSQCKFM